ncbi:MAG: enoyl-CoA hydratase-related protein, partial [Gammaproteobacteria bacterium]|nr:enoyl-CoA hydratase-related protein [Gammaproteobacteria bacterium]
MKYSGKSLSVEVLASGVAKLTFDLSNSSVNKFNKVTLEELRDVVVDLKDADVTGLIFSSAKPAFIVGADITEFTGMFASSESEITEWLSEGNRIFNDIEDLPYPTVTTINGVALGGGFEMALATDFRIGAPNCVVGFPEVKLGILPGFGGTVRLPRLLGADNANQWISSGAQIRSKQALAEGALDAIVEAEKLISAAEDLIAQCNERKFNIEEIRLQKTSPLKLSTIELSVAYETAMGMVSGKAGPHYPAPLTSVKVMRDASTFGRAEALKIEHQGFLQLAKTKAAANLVQMFLNDQHLSNSAKSYVKSAGEVKSA